MGQVIVVIVALVGGLLPIVVLVRARVRLDRLPRNEESNEGQLPTATAGLGPQNVLSLSQAYPPCDEVSPDRALSLRCLRVSFVF